MEEEVVRTRREVTETTTEEDEDREVLFDGDDAETKGETDSDERGRTLNRKTVTTTVRVRLGRKDTIKAKPRGASHP